MLAFWIIDVACQLEYIVMYLKSYGVMPLLNIFGLDIVLNVEEFEYTVT